MSMLKSITEGPLLSHLELGRNTNATHNTLKSLTSRIQIVQRLRQERYYVA